MKKILLLMLMFAIGIGAFAQTCYKLTGDNVYVRTGPGTNYGKVHYTGAYGSPEDKPVMLAKGAYVFSRGAAKNGFMPVREAAGYATYWGEGWVSTKYLTKATKCVNCNGKGFFNQVCPECGGDAYHACECDGTGKKICKKCWGIGYK